MNPGDLRLYERTGQRPDNSQNQRSNAMFAIFRRVILFPFVLTAVALAGGCTADLDLGDNQKELRRSPVDIDVVQAPAPTVVQKTVVHRHSVAPVRVVREVKVVKAAPKPASKKSSTTVVVVHATPQVVAHHHASAPRTHRRPEHPTRDARGHVRPL